MNSDTDIIIFCKKKVPSDAEESVAYRCRKHIHNLRNLIDYNVPDKKAGPHRCKLKETCENELFYLEQVCYQESNQNYFNVYVKLVEKIYEYLGSPIHQSVNQISTTPSIFTDHGAGHAFSVAYLASDTIARRIDELFEESNNEISCLESFILLCAAWIHDIGMFIDIPDFSRDDIRNNHGRISGDVFHLIIDSIKLANSELRDTIEDFEKRNIFLLISLVSAAHQTSVWKKNTKRLIAGCAVRVEMLGDILKFADALDIQEARANKLFYNFLQNFYGAPSESSVFEWNLNNSMMEYHDGGQWFSYDFYFDREFVDKVKSYKIKEYKGIKKRYIASYIKSRFLASFLRYIKLYLLDHYNKINHETVRNALKRMDLKFYSVYKLDRGKRRKRLKETYNILPKYALNRKHYNSINQKEYWVSLANRDWDLAECFTAMREKAQLREVEDIFLFLKDAETRKYRLYAGPNVYEAYKNSFIKKNLVIERLGETVTIPSKCGIIGYVAWTGNPEDVKKMRMDPRTSYSDYDKCLTLQNIVVMNLFDNTRKTKDRKKVGVLLLNYNETDTHVYSRVGRRIRRYNNLIPTNNDVLKELLGNGFKTRYNFFMKLLEQHRV